MPFQDILDGNADYVQHPEPEVSGSARLGLAILSCMDTRIDPLTAFGLKRGDAKMLRNAGARVTDDMLRSLAICVHALGVTRVALIAHTDCGGTKVDQQKMEQLVLESTGGDASDVDFLTTHDQVASLREDKEKISRSSLIPDTVEVGMFIYDVHSGKLEVVE